MLWNEKALHVIRSQGANSDTTWDVSRSSALQTCVERVDHLDAVLTKKG